MHGTRDRMVRLEDIATMNPWWAKGAKFAYYDKDLAVFQDDKSMIQFERQIPKMDRGNVYMVKGPRRVGKTVWIKKLIKKLLEDGTNPMDIFYYSMDNVGSSKELENLLHQFFYKPHSGTIYLFLDEIQSVEGWEFVIKGFYDSGALADAVTVVTGSISHMLNRETLPGRGVEGNTFLMRCLGFRDFCKALLSDIHTEYGANRINKLIGYNFTNEEMEAMLALLDANSINLEMPIHEIYRRVEELAKYAVPLRKMIEIYLRTGGYPASINSYLRQEGAKPMNKIDYRIYEEIYNYAKNDAAMLAGKGGSREYSNLVLRSTLEHLGMNISYSKLAKHVGMNVKTFIGYSQRLDDSYAFIRIRGIDEHMESLEVQKVYFGDVFMHYAAGAAISGEEPNAYSENLLNSISIGSIAEEVIASHLVMTKEVEPMRNYHTYLGFFHGKSNKEIDFVYKRYDGSYLGIEVKYQNFVSIKNDLNKVKAIKEYILLTKDELDVQEDAVAVPIYLFLALLEKSDHDL